MRSLITAILLFSGMPIFAGDLEDAKAVQEQISAAERIVDNYGRCLAYPNPRGYRWSRAAMEAFCADQFTPRLDWVEFRTRVEKGEAHKVDAQLDSILKAHAAGRLPEGAARGAYYDNFSNSGARTETLLDQWRSQVPNSAHALAARGIHRVARASQIRGESLYRDVPATARKKMSTELARARVDLEQALKADPGIWPATIALIDIGRMGGDQELGSRALSHALKVDPTNYYVRTAYLFMKLPQWGGSFEEMDEIVLDAKPLIAKNPRLSTLEAYAKGYRGFDAYRQRDYDKALQLAERGLVFGPSTHVLEWAPFAALKSGRYLRAIELDTQYLRLYPNYIRVRMQRAWTYHTLKMHDAARADYERILAIEPNHLEANRGLAAILLDTKNSSEAERRLTALLAANPADAWVKQKLAWLYMYRKRDFKAAAPLIEELLASSPESGAAWLLKADWIQNTNGPGLREAAEKFVKYADVSDEEQRQALPKVQAWLARQKSKN